MLTRRYMYEYGATREHLAEVAMAIRSHANRNPAALMHDRTMSLDDYMASRLDLRAALSFRQLPRDGRRARRRRGLG